MAGPVESAGQKRTFLFALSDEEQQDATSLVSYAKRVPMFRKTGNEIEDERLASERKAFIRVLNGLWRTPAIASRCADWVDERAAAHIQSAKVSHDSFESVSVVKALDEIWVCSYIVKVTPIRLATLEWACANDPDTWRQIVTFLMVLGLSLKLNKVCKEKEVLRVTWDARVLHCGSRGNLFNDATLLVKETGFVDWSNNGVYTVIFVKDLGKKLVHRPSGAEVDIPSVLIVDRTFALKSNWSDYDACLVKGPHEFSCRVMFPDQVGPNTIKIWAGSCKEFEEATNRARIEVDGARRAAVRHAVVVAADNTFKATAKAAGRRKSMEKAREALTERKVSLNNKRTVTFGAAASST
jgi:hypothetical protein